MREGLECGSALRYIRRVYGENPMTPDPRHVPVPRPLVPKKGKGTGLGCMRLLMIPHLLIGIGILAYTLFLATLVFFGETVEGTVTGTSSTSDDDGTSYSLDYAFRYDFTTYAGQSTVSQGMYETAKEGDAVRVRVHPLFPEWGSHLDDLDETELELPFLAVFTLFWNAIMAVFVWIAYVHPARLRSLLRYGAVAEGHIASREMRSGKKTTWTIRFRFVPMGSSVATPGVPVDGTMSVGRGDYEHANEGNHVTVVYDARKPSRCVVYDYAPYEIRTP